jgi:hypothetical protein
MVYSRARSAAHIEWGPGDRGPGKTGRPGDRGPGEWDNDNVCLIQLTFKTKCHDLLAGTVLTVCPL